MFRIHPETADLTFGGITVATGIFGTLSGGVVLDRMGGTLQHALVLCACGIGAGAALVIAAFALAPSFAAFTGLFALGEFAMFMTQVSGLEEARGGRRCRVYAAAYLRLLSPATHSPPTHSLPAHRRNTPPS